MKRWGMAVAVLVTLTAVAFAGMRVAVDKMTVDGLEVRALRCQLHSGGMFAMMQVVGALAKKKKALDACAPEGAAFAVTWTWGAKGEVTTADVVRASAPAKKACVVKAVKKAKGPSGGTCEAIILTGKAAAAGKAADALVAAPPAPPAPPKK